ncbi:MAG: hypothetical protein AAF959_01265 [Cyanobacteria bacterium P01_D01_bin.56]
MPSSIQVEANVVGRRRPLLTDWAVPLPPEIETGGNPFTLRDLITCVVHAEVDAFHTRQAEQTLQRVLTKDAIAEGLTQGKVIAGEREFEHPVDANFALDTAILGFIDGLYYVFLDDVQQEDLDATVHLTPNSCLTFIRLVALVGG